MNVAVPPDDEQFPSENSGLVDEPPDGGYGWVCVACTFFINAHTWGLNTVCPSEITSRATLTADLVIWCVSCSLSCPECLSWRNLPRVCFCWRLVGRHGLADISDCYLHNTSIRHTYYLVDWSVFRNDFLDWCILFKSDLAALPKSRRLLRVGNGISFCWLCCRHSSVVYQEKEPCERYRSRWKRNWRHGLQSGHKCHD